MRTMCLCMATALVMTTITAVAGTAKHDVIAPAFVPACPHATYGADGNMGPLFCVADNPIALHHYAKMGRRTFALDPSATPGQVVAALNADWKTAGTGPILCSIYRLAAWRNHWSFGVSPTSSARIGWCGTPSFSKVGP